MKIKEIAAKYVEADKVEEYLKFELPNEDPERDGFELVASDDDADLYRASDVYLFHCLTGLEIGMWDDFASDYPQAAHLLPDDKT